MVLTSLDLVASNAPITTRIKLVNGDEETPMGLYSVLNGQKGVLKLDVSLHQDAVFDLGDDWQSRVVRFPSGGRARTSGRAL